MAEMMTTTYDIDKAAYQQEQTLFLADQSVFRTGIVGAGLYALGHLKAMYRLLWYRKHKNKDEKEAAKFLDLIKTVEEKILKYASGHKNDQPSETIFKMKFRELVGDFELVVERYQQIIIVCEAKT